MVVKQWIVRCSASQGTGSVTSRLSNGDFSIIPIKDIKKKKVLAISQWQRCMPSLIATRTRDTVVQSN